MKFQHLKKAKLTKKARKLLKGGNAAVNYSLEKGQEIGGYIVANPVYINKAKPYDLPDFVKVRAGVPFVRPELHNLSLS